MIVLGIDVESTGVDPQKDRILELGCAIWDTDLKVPIELFSTFISDVNIEESHKPALLINGIRQEWLKHGMPLEKAFRDINNLMFRHGVSHVIAHNGTRFDQPIILEELRRTKFGVSHNLAIYPWLDTMLDLPFEKEPANRSLISLCAEHGFVNSFPHRAVFDVLAMLKLMGNYSFEAVLEQAKIPWIVVRVLVDYENRDKAKELRYSWEQLGDKKYTKSWVKKIRANQLKAEQDKALEKGLKVVQIDS